MSNYLASNLKVLRGIKRYSQSVTAVALGIKRSSYSGYEQGTSEPDVDLLATIGEYTQLPIDILIRCDLSTIPPSRIEEQQRRYPAFRAHAF